MTTQKPSRSRKTAAPDLLATALFKTRRTFLYATIFSLCLNLLTLALPLYSLQVLDRVMSSASAETLLMLTFIVIVAFVFYGIFQAVRSFILNGVTVWLDQTLAPRLVGEAITRSAVGISANAGQYQRDLATIKNFIAGGPLATLMDAPWSVIFLLVIYLISPVLGFLTVVGLVLLIGFGLLNELATRKAYENSTEFAVRSQTLADTASRNAEAIEAMGMMHNVLEGWKAINLKSTDLQMSGTQRSTIIQAVSRSLRMILQIAVTGVGGYLVIKNVLSVGGMIAASMLVGRALAPFEGAITIWKSWVSARDSYRRLQRAIAGNELLARGNVPLPAPEGHLSAENVIFTPPGGKPIIKGVSFKLEPGESLGVIGPSAAGKSTLARLLVGLLPPNHGSVRLDGAETFKWNRADFGQYVGYLPQHVDLFDGTIKDNIARMDVEAPMERVIEAAKLARVHDLILHLPQGYETDCGAANLALSPGQRQRIGMARALYGFPRFVVLDEPNSNLDGDGERSLIESLQWLKSQKVTFVVVAHRPTIVSIVDKLLVLRAGTIERFGPRDEIMKQYVAPSLQKGAMTG